MDGLGELWINPDLSKIEREASYRARVRRRNKINNGVSSLSSSESLTNADDDNKGSTGDDKSNSDITGNCVINNLSVHNDSSSFDFGPKKLNMMNCLNFSNLNCNFRHLSSTKLITGNDNFKQDCKIATFDIYHLLS